MGYTKNYYDHPLTESEAKKASKMWGNFDKKNKVAKKMKGKREFRSYEQLLDKHGSPQDRIMVAKNIKDGRGVSSHDFKRLGHF